MSTAIVLKQIVDRLTLAQPSQDERTILAAPLLPSVASRIALLKTMDTSQSKQVMGLLGEYVIPGRVFQQLVPLFPTPKLLEMATRIWSKRSTKAFGSYRGYVETDVEAKALQHLLEGLAAARAVVGGTGGLLDRSLWNLMDKYQKDESICAAFAQAEPHLCAQRLGDNLERCQQFLDNKHFWQDAAPKAQAKNQALFSKIMHQTAGLLAHADETMAIEWSAVVTAATDNNIDCMVKVFQAHKPAIAALQARAQRLQMRSAVEEHALEQKAARRRVM